MRGRNVTRLLPAALAGGLMVLSTLAPARGVFVKPSPQLDTYATNTCGSVLQQGGSDVPLTLDPGHGVLQPVTVSSNIASCSLTVDPYTWCSNTTTIYQWDPAALAPDPTTVALRTFSTLVTSSTSSGVRRIPDPPIVVRSAPGVAEPPRGTLVMDYRDLTTYPTSNTLHYQMDGPVDAPGALEFTIGGPSSPIPGPHPVLSHAICAGDANIQAMIVGQDVMTADTRLDASSWTLVQKFQVPRAMQMLWVELAFANAPYDGTLDLGTVMVLDATNQSIPPVFAGTSLYDRQFLVYGPGISPASGLWVPLSYGTGTPLLLPNNDYWLWVSTVKDYTLYSRSLTGTESADFKQRIGPLFEQTESGGSWVQVPGRAMSFRVIGLPTGTLDAPLPPRPGSSLRLRATPNPSRGAVLVRWSGAAGTLWLDVLDARGRRVARAEGAGGEWRWSGLDEAGRALPAGVYFVRGTDDAGRVASGRIVLVR